MKETENKEPYNYNDEALKQIEDGCMSSIIGYSLVLIAIFLMALYLKS